MRKLKLINFSGDLFATVLTFAGQTAIRLGSSIVLTRILVPADYGKITIIISVAYVIALLADTNVALYIVREPHGDQPRYLNTAWTIRLVRSAFNTGAMFVLAPFVATSIYHVPSLTAPLRVFGLSFLIGGFQSMSLQLAIRRKQVRLITYWDLAIAFVSTTFSVIYCYFSRTYWGMIYGILLNGALTALVSQFIYPHERPHWQFDRSAARSLLGLSKYTMPSSLLTLALNQYDKIVLLRLFDLKLLGIYGLAGNIVGSIESLISKISQMVLYPRLAHGFRDERNGVARVFYRDNLRLVVTILVLPALIGAAAPLLVQIIYPAKYTETGIIIRILMLRAALLALAAPAEDLLIATGQYQVILHGNIVRAIALVAGTLLGYETLGFFGFVLGAAFSGLPPLVYYWYLQARAGLMIRTYELYKLGFMLAVAAMSYFVSALLAPILLLARQHI